MERGVTRGEIWLAQVGRKSRPVLVLTRSEVIDVRNLVTVAEVTTSIRGLAAEVDIDHDDVGLDQPSVINCDGLHTVAQASLTTYVGGVSEDTMRRVCSAVDYALGC
jgi:mRNA-degrading endonuclease toxin of MazEF toxin-antitoxin module